jgi:hypothetical protein
MYVITLYGIHLETNKTPKSSDYNRIILSKKKKEIIFNSIENYLLLNFFYSILKFTNWIE